jgi:hypothetical protein
MERSKPHPHPRGFLFSGRLCLTLGFPGQYWDAESGLWHNRYRDYDYSRG